MNVFWPSGLVFREHWKNEIFLTCLFILGISTNAKKLTLTSQGGKSNRNYEWVVWTSGEKSQVDIKTWESILWRTKRLGNIRSVCRVGSEMSQYKC
jgi:hypothetical protein